MWINEHECITEGLRKVLKTGGNSLGHIKNYGEKDLI